MTFSPRQCQQCGREERGIGRSYVGGTSKYCSLKCRDTHKLLEDKVVDFTELEERNILDAAMTAGEYMAEIGKTDFAFMTEEERMTFLKCFVQKYHENYGSSQFILDDNIPY